MDWSCQISFRTFAEFEHHVKLILDSLTSLQSATWRYWKETFLTYSAAKNAFNNDFLPKFKIGLIMLIASEKSKFRGAISRRSVSRSLMDGATNEIFGFVERFITAMPENPGLAVEDVRKRIERYANRWDAIRESLFGDIRKWVNNVLLKELEKFFTDLRSLLEGNYYLTIRLDCRRGFTEDCILQNAEKLGPLSFVFVGYFETLRFHQTVYWIHYSIKFAIGIEFCSFYSKLEQTIKKIGISQYFPSLPLSEICSLFAPRISTRRLGIR
jgi:hypothetical protein